MEGLALHYHVLPSRIRKADSELLRHAALLGLITFNTGGPSPVAEDDLGLGAISEAELGS